MSKFWLVLWIILLICQLLSALISRHMSEKRDLPPDDLDPSLLELAKETNEFLAGHAISSRKSEMLKAVSRNESLMTRESLIIELKELESRMISNGVEQEIVADLQAYLRTLDGSESVITINFYLAGIIDWLELHLQDDRGCHLERVNIYPAKMTAFPVLAFEMSGSPKAMGEVLLAAADGNSRLNLDELDLLLGGQGTGCWLRGSYSFSNTWNPNAE